VVAVGVVVAIVVAVVVERGLAMKKKHKTRRYRRSFERCRVVIHSCPRCGVIETGRAKKRAKRRRRAILDLVRYLYGSPSLLPYDYVFRPRPLAWVARGDQ
jgi:hypothetical protein